MAAVPGGSGRDPSHTPLARPPPDGSISPNLPIAYGAGWRAIEIPLRGAPPRSRGWLPLRHESGLIPSAHRTLSYCATRTGTPGAAIRQIWLPAWFSADPRGLNSASFFIYRFGKFDITDVIWRPRFPQHIITVQSHFERISHREKYTPLARCFCCFGRSFCPDDGYGRRQSGTGLPHWPLRTSLGHRSS